MYQGIPLHKNTTNANHHNQSSAKFSHFFLDSQIEESQGNLTKFGIFS